MLGAADILIWTGFWAGICGAGRVCVAWGGILTPVTASGRVAGENGGFGRAGGRGRPVPRSARGAGARGAAHTRQSARAKRDTRRLTP